MKTCFVVCPIGEDGSDIRKRSDKLLKHIIKPVCTNCDFECIRVDELNLSDSLTETILEYLKNSDLVIADLTDHNPNAFYEIGYRTALNKPIIHLKDKSINIPFDVSTIRTFDYDLTDLDLVDSLKERLVKTINSIQFVSDPTSNNISENKIENFNSQILEELFKIQDSILYLSENLINKQPDTSTISILADKLVNTSMNAKTPETVMMEFFSNMLANPKQLETLIDLSNKLPDSK